MLFNSFEFLIFLPIVFALYWYIGNYSLKFQNLILLTASYFFYGWWSWKFLGLLFLSTLLDFIYGFSVSSNNRKKAKFFLWLSIINNLGILCIFKYYNFFAIEFQQLFNLLNLNCNIRVLNLVLPIGISFYTFHGMSYVFDIYNGRQRPIHSFFQYAVFVSFFPLLVAGPIERATHLLPQIQKNRTFNYSKAVSGCRLILWGFFKKIVIADSLASIVNEIYSNYTTHNAPTLIIGAISFSFQIYCDFSGYTDIALGVAKLFGFELLSNFKFPYFARDVAEFWRRWHISLSSWFKDYLYIPLGGSKEGKFKAIRNTLIIFLVSGFWHGASWNFILWGTIHAFGFLPLQLMQKNRTNISSIVAFDKSFPSIKELSQITFTFIFVTIAWIFFRSENLQIAFDYVKLIFIDSFKNPSNFLSLPLGKFAFVYIIPFVCIDWYLRQNERELRVPNNKVLRHLIYWILLILIFIHTSGDSNSFIYFQF